MSIAIVGMMDERADGLLLIREYIANRGLEPVLVDISMGTGALDSPVAPDVDNSRLASAGGMDIAAVKAMLATTREKATATMAAGLGVILSEMHAAGGLQGVIAVGGMTGTFISLTAMRQLPYGLPKLMISSAAAMPAYARKLADFFGLRDITVMHSVIDTVGSNAMVRRLLRNGAGAICGMAECLQADSTGFDSEIPSIALTEFGFCEQGAHHIRARLSPRFETVSFHANGIGDRAVRELVGQGDFEAFIDLVPAGYSEYLLGGNRAAGPDRLDAGAKLGKPYILAPGGFDMIGCGPIERRDSNDPLWESRSLAHRKLARQDALRVQARTNSDEMALIARHVAERLNRYTFKQTVKVVIPLRGFSSLSVENAVLYDPVADRAFIDTLNEHLDPSIETVHVDTHINAPQFADTVADILNRCLQTG